MKQHFDLAVAWDWEFDREFVRILESYIQEQRLLFYSVTHHNVNETLRNLQNHDLDFGVFLDRASDADEKFLPLTRFLLKTNTRIINPPEAIHHAADKATMHLEFLSEGIDVPFTIIVSPYAKKKEAGLSLSDLAHLGRPFIIKPANTTGGGIGVITGAETLKDVIDSRQHHKNDKYLLQEKVKPIILDGKKSWYRVFFIFGQVLPCWWDDQTHMYTMMTKGDVVTHGLRPLITITKKIEEVCKLDFFSTEIAATSERKFIAVDYVNEICDMRLASLHADGVPDLVVHEICRKIARHMKKPKSQSA